MIIPEEIVTFLEGATVGFATTRDDRRIPQLHRLEAWIVGKDRETITCLLAADHDAQLIPSLEANGQFSFTTLASTSGPRASRPPNPGVDFHECYQFKGDFEASRPANEDDLLVVNRTAEQFKGLFQPLFGFSDKACAARFSKPVLSITFKVREIYDQTPGPGAGARIRTGER